jgi:hypothetical protein
MPRGDGTGPMGYGPMTGRGAGYCAGYEVPGYMSQISRAGFGNRGCGFGGFGGGRGRRNRFLATAVCPGGCAAVGMRPLGDGAEWSPEAGVGTASRASEIFCGIPGRY